MTIRDLILALKQYGPDIEVVGAWDSGYGRITDVEYDDKSRLILLDVSEYENFDE